MKTAYLGIDYADDSKKRGECTIEDDGTTLRVTSDSQSNPRRIGIDAPMGLPRGYVLLLDGQMPPEASMTFRATDIRLQERVAGFSVVDQHRKVVSRLFNKSSHVRSPAALQIVPGAIREALDLVTRSEEPSERRRLLAEIRLGNERVVEAHPRLFLYSVLQRCAQAADEALLVAAKDYKDSRQDDGGERRKNRKLLRDFLQHQTEWCGHARRIDADESILVTDHVFDAWLAALTAWAHEMGNTWTWTDAAIDRETVEVEGHMLILRTDVEEGT